MHQQWMQQKTKQKIASLLEKIIRKEKEYYNVIMGDWNAEVR